MNEATSATRGIGILRATIGLLQGVVLYFLYVEYEDKTWPATDGLIFAPLLVVAVLAPLVLIHSLGNLRSANLTAWALVIMLLAAAGASYDIWHAWPEDFGFGPNPVVGPHILPSPALLMALGAAGFIAHSLILGGEADRRVIARYTTHFDIAWKIAVQAVLSATFAVVFWGMLRLGAGLFQLIRVDFVWDLIQRRWFAIPVTTLAIALGIHITDVHAGLVRGIRTLGLALVSWLLPLMTLISASFLAALLFTGVQPLWDTRFATALLLAAAAVLIVLVNATYQDGEPERAPPRWLRYSGTVAVFLLIPLVALAAYALHLRIEQYGWTVDRIYAAACVLVAAWYTLGYTIAALWPSGAWLNFVELWNFFAALVVLTVLLALFSPIADPYRISVADQLARLQSGVVMPEQFDFANLRWEGGRFGYAALEQLKATKEASQDNYVYRMAEAASKATNRNALVEPRTTQEIVASRVVMHTPDGHLPASFLPENLNVSVSCLRRGNKCDVWITDVTGDGVPEVLIFDDLPTLAAVTAFAEKKTPGKWEMIGSWTLPSNCPSLSDKLHAGELQTDAPSPPPFADLEIGGQRYAAQVHGTALPCPD